MILRIRWRQARRERQPREPRLRSLSLRYRLRLSLVGLVAALAVVQGVATLRLSARAQFEDAIESSQSIAFQVRSLLLDALNQKTLAATPPPQTLAEMIELWTSLLEQDPAWNAILEKLLASSRSAVEIQICDQAGRILASSSPARPRMTYRSMEDFAGWRQRRLWDRLYEVLVHSREYVTVVPLGVAGFDQPLFTIRVIASSVLLRAGILPQIRSLAVMSLFTVVGAILVAIVFSNLVVRSLDVLGRRIDRITAGEFDPPAETPTRESREIAAVSSKLTLLSEQFRGVREDASLLRGNVDQLLESLEAAVLMFDADHRLVLAGKRAESLLGVSRRELIGKNLEALFPPSTPLGALIQDALSLRVSFRDRPTMLARSEASPIHVLASVDLLERTPDLRRLGLLITLRDVEPRRWLRSQLDVSGRLAAINRLTGGVAHEIKNPLNAIALHLEVLKAKLAEPGLVETELRVIEREITRLDRVVKTFLDFTRPFELKIDTVDLAALLQEVAALVRPEAERNGVEVEPARQAGGALIRGDPDLLKQAILNVVVNGIEAMRNGGRLDLGIRRDQDEYVVSIADQGPGIPAEVQDKIFNLYFTTKEEGSGIGLAMTFRVIHLHGGAIDFTSEPGQGTVFRMRLPVYDEPGGSDAGQAPSDGRSVAVGTA
jgi:signal transduction histidine kinase